MITICGVIKEIDDYKRIVGYPPPRIAVTPDQMRDLVNDPESKKIMSKNDDGFTTFAGVIIDVWGRPKRVVSG